MDKTLILKELSEVAHSLDQKSYHKQADQITELMVRVAASPYPAPTNPGPPPKGFWGNIGDALGQGANAVAGVAKAVPGAVMQAVKYPVMQGAAAANAVADVARAAPGAVMQAVKYPVMQGAAAANALAQPGMDVQRIYNQEQMRYSVDSGVKSIIDQVFSELQANPKMLVTDARFKAKSLASARADLNQLAQQIYKTDLSTMVANGFDIYVVPSFRQRLESQVGPGAYIDSSGRAVAQKTNSIPVANT